MSYIGSEVVGRESREPGSEWCCWKGRGGGGSCQAAVALAIGDAAGEVAAVVVGRCRIAGLARVCGGSRRGSRLRLLLTWRRMNASVDEMMGGEEVEHRQ